MSPRAKLVRRRMRNYALLLAAVGIVAAANGPTVTSASAQALDDWKTSRPEYKAVHGHWRTVDLPEKYRLNAIHSVLLRSGKVLIVAGSGNNQKMFDAKTFKTTLWDPIKDTYTAVKTPEDLFCGGHAQLADGNILIAGGTRKYEILADDVKKVAGVMSIKNQGLAEVKFPKGTTFKSPKGHEFISTEDAVVPPKHAMGAGQDMEGTFDVWVESKGKGKESVIDGAGVQFQIEGLSLEASTQVYGQADTLTLKKQEYQGIRSSYIFNVTTEKYEEVGKLNYARWYPTLLSIKGGNVLAVSGLDEHGVVLDGQNEVYEPSAKKWFDQDKLKRYFPTYPALFRLKDERIFFSGSNAGYGSATVGRTPGFWNLANNTFKPIAGLEDQAMAETSSSVLLPPAQDQKVLIAGGGAVGDKPQSTARVSVIDTDAKNPKWVSGKDYPSPARYISTVILPTDTVLMTGGSKGYRGNGLSNLNNTSIYDPQTGDMEAVAANRVGRNYHSEALLVPDGRVITLGSDSTFADKAGRQPGVFETRVEIFEPPYLFADTPKPVITEAPTEVQRGTTFNVDVDGLPVANVTGAKLIRPSAVTHVTDVEQRSVRLDVTQSDGGLALSLDKTEGLTPSGWYMLFLTSRDNVPSTGHWVHVL